MTSSLTIKRPDDWHCHLREGTLMKAVTPFSSAVFGRVIAMPNLLTPLTTPALARAYKQELLKNAPPSFTPLIPCYLQEHTSPKTVLEGFETGDFFAVKYYPRGATTLSHLGVHDWKTCASVFDAMTEVDMPLLIHGEVTDPLVDMFFRESTFLTDVLTPLMTRHPRLRIVLEHLTTKDAVDFITHANHPIAATITAHHLVLTRTHILEKGLHPHRFCYPIAKTEKDRQALRKAATSGNPRFMLGTDSAPHTNDKKYQHTAHAGIFTSPIALPLYAQVFAEENALDKLEAFASLNGPRFHNLPTNQDTLTLKKETPPSLPSSWSISPPLTDDKHTLTVFTPPQDLSWSLHPKPPFIS